MALVQPQAVFDRDDADREFDAARAAWERDVELDRFVAFVRALDRELLDAVDRGEPVDLDTAAAAVTP